MTDASAPQRARLFRYAGLDVDADRLTGRYELDGRTFAESVTIRGRRRRSTTPAPARWPDSGTSSPACRTTRSARRGASTSPTRPSGAQAARSSPRRCRRAGRVRVPQRARPRRRRVRRGQHTAPGPRSTGDPRRVLTPFGGGIDSVVTRRGARARSRPGALRREPRRAGASTRSRRRAAVSGLADRARDAGARPGSLAGGGGLLGPRPGDGDGHPAGRASRRRPRAAAAW